MSSRAASPVRRYKLTSLGAVDEAAALAGLYASDPALGLACVDLTPGCAGPPRSCWPG